MEGEMSYEAWKASGEPEFYAVPSDKQIADKLKSLDHEIEWLTGRLANLSLSDDDFDQTQDYLFELRQERESLKRCFNV
jgi:prefoldin subunit 5